MCMTTEARCEEERERNLFCSKVLDKLLVYMLCFLLGNQPWSLSNFLALLSKTPVSEFAIIQNCLFLKFQRAFSEWESLSSPPQKKYSLSELPQQYRRQTSKLSDVTQNVAGV